MRANRFDEQLSLKSTEFLSLDSFRFNESDNSLIFPGHWVTTFVSVVASVFGAVRTPRRLV
jgi:hypothetical protein